MGLLMKGIKYGAIAPAARRSGKASATTHSTQQQQVAFNQANGMMAQQAAEHQQEQQNLVNQANDAIAQQQREHEQALREQEERLKQQYGQQQQQQCLPAPPPHAYPSAPGTPAPYSTPSTPGVGFREVNGYQHQTWCNLQCGQTCHAVANSSIPAPLAYGQPYQSPSPCPSPSPLAQAAAYQAPVYQAYH